MVSEVQLWTVNFVFTSELLYRGHALSEQSLINGDSLWSRRPDARMLSIVAIVLECQGKVPTAKTSLPFAPTLISEGPGRTVSYLRFLFSFNFILLFLETGSHLVSPTSFKLMAILRPQPPESWESR